MEAFDFITYMRNIAIQLKDIAHVENDDKKQRFFRVSGIANLEEFLQNLTFMDGYVLIAEDGSDHTGNIFSSNTDNWLDTQSYVFFVAKHVDVEDADSKESVLNGCKAVGYKVLSKIVKDYYDENAGTKTRTAIYTWDNRVNHQVVGPIGDNFFGIMYQLTFLPNIASKIVYNANDWVNA
jgi:hypothetical protein